MTEIVCLSKVDAIMARFIGLYRERLACVGPVALHEPWFAGNEWTYVRDCIDSGWVSSVGSYVDRFEQDLARVTGAKFAVATVNGTCALHVTLHALGVRRGDLVLCPALSFAATANAIAHCGAEPLFIDVGKADLAMDAQALVRFLSEECVRRDGGLSYRPTGQRIAAVMAVHLFGHPARIEEIAAGCAVHGVPLVEDAAEALGSLYRQRSCGTFGRAGVLSFNGNKTLTTGGGGAILTDDAALAARLKHLTTTARVAKGWEFDHDEVGFNYRMPNINAALGYAQLELLPSFIECKRRLAEMVGEAFARCDSASVLGEPPECRSNFWLNSVILENRELRDRILDRTNAAGLQTRPCFRPLCDLPMYRDSPQAATGLAVARDMASRLVNIPSGPKLAGGDAG